MTTANIIPTAATDGLVYGTNVPLTSTEADLGDGLLAPDPIAVAFGQSIVAVVKLSINGYVVANNCYVVMQTDMGDGTWVDIAWCVWTGHQGDATFILWGGGANGGIGTNSVQQSRQVGQFPASLGSVDMPLAGRIRFVGKSMFTGGSSSLAGVATSVSATIKYKILCLR